MLEKPPKRETGRTKGKKEHVRDDAWERAERESSRWLLEHDGKNEEFQYRFMQSSTGRVGEHANLGFDSVSANHIGECKQRKMAAWIIDAWRQLTGLAVVHKKHPVLFLWIKDADPWMTVEGRKVRMPNPMHCVTPAYHASLLQAEKERDSLLLEIEELKKRFKAECENSARRVE
jgi:hypothetical protein